MDKKKLHNFAHRGNLAGIQKILETTPEYLNANLEVKAANASQCFHLLFEQICCVIIPLQVGDGHALIHRCATRGHLECVEWLLDQEGINIDLLDEVCPQSCCISLLHSI